MKKPKLTPEERRKAKLVKKAEAHNAKVKDQLGIFAGFAKDEGWLRTAEDEYWRARRLTARGVEQGHLIYAEPIRAYQWFELFLIEQYARPILGAWFDEVAAYVRHTYPSADYMASAWAGILAGEKQIVFSYRHEQKPEWVNQHNREGKRAFPGRAFPPQGWTPPMTKEQFWALFPYEHSPKLEQPDDGGIYENLQRALTRI